MKVACCYSDASPPLSNPFAPTVVHLPHIHTHTQRLGANDTTTYNQLMTLRSHTHIYAHTLFMENSQPHHSARKKKNIEVTEQNP